ncbi:MAG: hypothetical protein ABW198_13460 [Pseudorhodoplanes sp.]
MLKYNCSKSGLQVTTSIETDDGTLATMERMKIAVWCPHCGRSHQIAATEAYVKDFDRGMRVLYPEP